MNPPTGRPPPRFMRGRGRGGGSYRPYYFFRRNGRVIPAAGNRQRNEGGSNATAAPARGWGRAANKITRKRNEIDCSFLRPENYVAPEDALQVQSVLVENPTACPGWRLYFLRDNYDAESELAKRISAVEAHYLRNPLKYDFVATRQTGHFKMPARGIIHDEELKQVWPTLGADMCECPMRTLATLAVAMHSVVSVNALEASQSQASSVAHLYVPQSRRTRKVYVRPEDFAPVELITNISHTRVDTMIAVRGIVSSVGEPTYGFSWHAYRCTRCQAEQALRQCGQHTQRPYHCKQTKCAAKENFVAMRSSPYTRLLVRQIIRIEESSLSLLTDYDTTLPGTLDIELRHDLVDAVHVGQEIVVTGVLKLRALSESNDLPAAASGGAELQAYLKAVCLQDARHVPREFSARDVEAIGMINGDPNSFKLLVQSLVPEVHGHELPKAACLLSLLGGAGSQLSEDSAINVLLVGDPGIGKSKILQMCAQITERGAHISGKRTAPSAAKLGATLAARNKRVLQAGALLSASNAGHCTIDDVDRLASKQALLLQAMQSGELNMPLAGQFASSSARPSIIACANPQRGQYDCSRYLLQNIRIMPALLKEFHLVYVLLDRPTDMARDVSLTEHVRALHAGAKKRANIAMRYAMKPKTSDSMYESTFYEGAQPEEDSIMKQDFDLDKRLALNELEDAELDLLPPILMKKFIAYARQSVKPLLTEAAAEAIKKHFLELRRCSEAEHERSQIGLGQLLGLIHLSQARARLDLSSIVMPAHVRDVISVLTESMAQTNLCPDLGTAPSNAGGSKGAQLRSFLRMMQMRSAALGRRIFEFEELKEMGTRAGIMTGITNLVDIANMQGHLLKKGANMYEVVPD